MYKRIVLACLLAVFVMPSVSIASMITFTHQGIGSGTLNGVNFGPSAFTFTGIGDTSNRQSFGSGFWINHDSASVNIVGLGTYNFTTGTRTFVNNTASIVGFSRASGSDLFNGPFSSQLSSWDMLSAIGPLSGAGNLLQWSNSPVNTSGGVLVFTSGSSSVVFEASLQNVPEPGSLAIWGFGLLGVGVCGRRRKVT